MPVRVRHRLPSHQPRRQLSQYFRIFFLIILLILIGLSVRTFISFRRTWDGQSTKNILIVPKVIDGFTGKIILAHFSPQTNTVSLVFFPATMMVNVIGGYGMYPLQSVYPLLTLDKKSKSFIDASESFALGQVIDGVWVAPQPNLLNQPLTPTQITSGVLHNQLQTSLTLLDKIWLWNWVRQLRADQATSESVADFTAWRSVQTKLSATTANPCSISVINDTQVKGVGAKVGDVLEKTGLNVIRVTDDTTAQATSSVISAEDPQCQAVVTHLQQLFPEPVTRTIDLQVMTHFRSNVAILIGKDLGSQLH